MVQQSPVCLGCESNIETWEWDQSAKCPGVVLSSNSRAVYFYTDPVEGSTGSAAARGTKGFHDGEHYWEIKLLEPARGTSLMIGVGTKSANLYKSEYQYLNLLGSDDQSWGLSYKGTVWHNGVGRRYCQPFYKESTIIGVLLDLTQGTLSFFQDGQPLGVAFTGLAKIKQELHPLISSTATNTELEVGVQRCRFMSLQERCFAEIVHSIQDASAVDKLLLPSVVKEQLVDKKSRRSALQ